MNGLLCALSFRKACGNELFNDSSAGGGCADSFSFRIFRHILFARRFHGVKEQVFREMLGRRGFTLLYFTGGYGNSLSFGERRNGFILLFLFGKGSPAQA